MNREPFETGEIYHVYNHGVEERNIFNNDVDIRRFLDSMAFFNDTESIGGMWLRDESFILRSETSGQKLVNIVSYCLNPNHFHLILEQLVDGGISEFMKRLSGGYTLYFNYSHERKGVLFRGTFKSVFVEEGEHLMYLSAYVNLNFKVHQIEGELLSLSTSSWNEYIGEVSSHGLCSEGKKHVLKDFSSTDAYKKYAESVLPCMLEKKKMQKELKYLAID